MSSKTEKNSPIANAELNSNEKLENAATTIDKPINLVDLYTGDDEAVRKNLLFYQKHYIEHTSRLVHAESSQLDAKSKRIITRKYATLKKIFSQRKKPAVPSQEVRKKHGSLVHSHLNLSISSSLSQILPKDYTSNCENEKQVDGRFKFLKEGKSYLVNKVKNLSITKKLSKFSR